jgi:hypothetical protein
MKSNTPMQLQVQEPCMQSWSSMTPDVQGRFCGACSHAVIDFSTYTDQQLIEFFAKSSTGRVCGRFRSGQLGRTLQTSRSRWTWIQSFVALLLSFFLESRVDGQSIDSIDPTNKKISDKIHIIQKARLMGMVMPKTLKPVKEVERSGKATDPSIRPVNSQQGNRPYVKGRVRLSR